MGNSKSKQPKQFDVKINHPRFQNSKIVTNQNTKYFQTNFTINQKQYDKWASQISRVETPPHNLLLPLKHNFSRKAMCGHTGTAVVDYQNYPYLLTDEIYDRRGKKSRFSEVQVWYLLYSLIRANGQACQIKQELVDLRPDNIFLNQDGNIKTSTNLSWPFETSNIIKAMDKEPTYLPPEDLERVSRKQIFDGPSELSLAFSMGLTALSVGNLRNYENLYDMKAASMDLRGFIDGLQEFRSNRSFSEVLRGTVCLLCSLDPSRRMTVAELNDLLLKHHSQIEAKSNFVVDNATQKLHEQIMQNRQLTGSPSQKIHHQVPQNHQSPPKHHSPQIYHQNQPIPQNHNVHFQNRPLSHNNQHSPPSFLPSPRKPSAAEGSGRYAQNGSPDRTSPQQQRQST